MYVNAYIQGCGSVPNQNQKEMEATRTKQEQEVRACPTGLHPLSRLLNNQSRKDIISRDSQAYRKWSAGNTSRYI